jgi:hypothetical protein
MGKELPKRELILTGIETSISTIEEAGGIKRPGDEITTTLKMKRVDMAHVLLSRVVQRSLKIPSIYPGVSHNQLVWVPLEADSCDLDTHGYCRAREHRNDDPRVRLLEQRLTSALSKVWNDKIFITSDTCHSDGRLKVDFFKAPDPAWVWPEYSCSAHRSYTAHRGVNLWGGDDWQKFEAFCLKALA